MEVPDTITCVDCGQPARRLSFSPEEGWQPGDYVAYRCTGCNDRWDLVVADESFSPAESPHSAEARAILRDRMEKNSER